MIDFSAEIPIPQWGADLVLYARDKTGTDISALTCVLQKNTINQGEIFPPFMTLHRDAGQSLFDELWRVGYRPNNGESSMAHVAAIKYHLEDMRKLVFDAQGRIDNG